MSATSRDDEQRSPNNPLGANEANVGGFGVNAALLGAAPEAARASAGTGLARHD
jgi:hypothetical protein